MVVWGIAISTFYIYRRLKHFVNYNLFIALGLYVTVYFSLSINLVTIGVCVRGCTAMLLSVNSEEDRNSYTYLFHSLVVGYLLMIKNLAIEKYLCDFAFDGYHL